MRAMRVSVVAPLYNEGAAAAALVAHLRQIPNLLEAILVDASDTPFAKQCVARLRKKLRDDAFARCIHCATPGRARQMNLGARQARGDILLFLHCDTRLPPDAVARIVDSVAGGSVWGWFALRLAARGLQYRVLEFMINARARCTHIATGDQAFFIARAMFRKHRGFAEIALMEDVEFARRMKRIAKPQRIASPVTTSARRWQQNGLLRTVWLMWRLRFWYWRGVHPRRLAARYSHAR